VGRSNNPTGLPRKAETLRNAIEQCHDQRHAAQQFRAELEASVAELTATVLGIQAQHERRAATVPSQVCSN